MYGARSLWPRIRFKFNQEVIIILRGFQFLRFLSAVKVLTVTSCKYNCETSYLRELV